MTTMPLDLRPLGMGQLLDRSIRLYRRNFLTFIGIVALAQVPNTIVAIGLTAISQSMTTTDNGRALLLLTGGALIGFSLTIVTAILTQIANGALTGAVADIYLGQKTDMINAYRRLGRRWLTLLGALLVTFLYTLGIMLWTIVPCIGWTTGLGMLLFSSSVIIPLVAPVVVLENQSASQAFPRAWNLARRRFWWVLGFVLLLSLFSLAVVTGPTSLVNFLVTQTLADTVGPMGSTIISQLVTFGLSIIYLPLQLTCITLLYFDIRVRTEGFDLAVLAAGEAGATSPEVIAETAQAQKKSSIGPTSDEMVYFFGISVAYGVLIFILASFAASLVPLLTGGF